MPFPGTVPCLRGVWTEPTLRGPRATDTAARSQRHRPHGTDPTAQTPWHRPHGTDPAAQTLWHGSHGTDPAARTPQQRPCVRDPMAQSPLRPGHGARSAANAAAAACAQLEETCRGRDFLRTHPHSERRHEAHRAVRVPPAPAPPRPRVPRSPACPAVMREYTLPRKCIFCAMHKLDHWPAVTTRHQTLAPQQAE